MRTACIVAVLAALAVAVHATDLEDTVARTIEDFKDMMPWGRPDLNIPVLDPATIKKVPLSITASPFNAQLVASDIKVKGASAFTVTELSQIGESSQINVAVEVPSVDVTGNYDINGQVKVGFFKVNLNNHGPLTIALKGIKGAGVADMLSKDDGSIHLNDLKINSWSYDELSVNFENLFDGGVMGKTVNMLINKLVPAFASVNNDKLTGLLESISKKYINKYLDGMAGTVATLDASVAQVEDWVVTPEVQEILDQLAVAVAAPVEDDTTDLEATVRKLSEDFRVAMKKGREDLGIAAMDPAVFPEVTVHFNKWLLDGQAVASDVQVSGASDFELTKVKALDATKVAIEYTIPTVSVVAKYDLDTKVNLGVTKVHSVRSGSLEMTVSGVKCAATAELIVETDGLLSLASYEVTSWSYDSLAIQVENPSNAGFIKRNVDKLIGKLVPSLLVKPHVNDLAAWASGRGLRLIGRFLDGVAGRIVFAGLDEKAAALLEDLKAVMTTGSTDFNMPVLDPFVLDRLPFDFTGHFVKASIVAEDLQVSGTSAFTISKISQIPDSNRITVEIEVPEINGSSKFEASGEGTWSHIKYAHDSGSLTARIQGLKVSATARLAETTEGSIILKDLNIDSWAFTAVSATFANLQHGMFGTLLNEGINAVLPTLIQVNKKVINDWAEVTAKAVLDQYLAGVAQAEASPVAVHINVLPAEARQIIMQLAALAA